jgi:hypothetical protein
MGQLTFFALSHTHKLNAIGRYLARCVKRDLARSRIAFVQREREREREREIRDRSGRDERERNKQSCAQP